VIVRLGIPMLAIAVVLAALWELIPVFYGPLALWIGGVWAWCWSFYDRQKSIETLRAASLMFRRAQQHERAAQEHDEAMRSLIGAGRN
jgi:hypothetical protein